LIKQFLANGCEVIIAGETTVTLLLEHEFQQLTFIPLRGYRIRYSKKRAWLPLTILAQIPGIILSIYREHKWIKKVVKKYAINAIIADNRFGLCHPGISSVYITHQLLIKTGINFTEKIIQKIHFWFIKKYTRCWVPDFEGNNNAAGELSHPLNYPSNVEYIGCLTRFEKKENLPKMYDLLILISGPEPQRTIFEKLILYQLQFYIGKAMLVRGLPGTIEKPENKPTLTEGSSQLVLKNHLTAPELNMAIQQSQMVISRSGYTTIMDLMKLQQSAILVPTPGQTEQEYLAGHLLKQHFFYTAAQSGFVLNDVLKKVDDFDFATPSFDMEQYKKVVREFVLSL